MIEPTTYDNLSRLLSVLHQVGVNTLDGAVYTYDPAGNRLSKADQLAGITSNFSYDPLYQLTGVSQGPTTTESYTYDAVGNRLSSLGLSPYQYNSSNELTSTPTTTYTYDKNGELKTKVDSTGTTTYNWDTTYRNLLTSIVLPGSGGTVSFRYDPFGRRIQKAGPLGTTNYLYDGFNLLEEVDQSGNVLARYAPTRNLDEPLSELRSGATSYYQQDRLGSVTSLSNSVGALANTYTYDSFGKLTASTGTITNPFQYTGREFDSETGLFFNRARYYDPQVGRFLSEDPIRFRGGANFYAYTRNNPVVLIDPLGYQGCSPAQWAQSPNACAGPQDPDAPYQGPDGLWYNVPEWGPPDPTPSLPSPTPSNPTPSPQPTTCNHQNPHHDCASAYWETAIGGGWIVGWLGIDLYVLGPAAFEEGPLEAYSLLFGHGAATVPAVPGVLMYVHGIQNITNNCPLIVDWFIGPGN